MRSHVLSKPSLDEYFPARACRTSSPFSHERMTSSVTPDNFATLVKLIPHHDLSSDLDTPPSETLTGSLISPIIDEHRSHGDHYVNHNHFANSTLVTDELSNLPWHEFGQPNYFKQLQAKVSNLSNLSNHFPSNVYFARALARARARARIPISLLLCRFLQKRLDRLDRLDTGS